MSRTRTTDTPASSPPSAGPASAGRVIAVLGLGAVLVLAQLYVTIPILPAVPDRYGVTVSAAAWIGSGFGLAFALGNLFVSPLSDRVDRRRLMAFALLAVAAAAALCGSAPGFATLVGARVVEGFVAAAYPPVALAYVVEAVPARFRHLGVAVLSSCFLLAGILGQAYALGVLAALDWHWVFWFAIPLLAVTAMLITRLPMVPRTHPNSTVLQAVTQLGPLIRRPALLVAYGPALTLLLTFVGMYSGLTGAVQDRYGIAGDAQLLLLRLPGLPGIVLAALFAGRLIARYGPHRAGTVALLTAAAGLVVEAAPAPLWVLLVGSAVFVAGLAVAVPAVVTVVGMAAGASRGAALAGYAFLIGLGASLAPLLVTALDGAGFTALCAVLAGLLLLAAGTMSVGPRPVPGRGLTGPASACSA